MAKLFKYAYQPSVLAEVFGGLLLGPSILGNIPGWTDTLFPKESLKLLQMVANVGLVLYLFLVGLELDMRLVSSNFKLCALIALAGTGINMAISGGTSYLMFKLFVTDDKHSFGVFYAFISVAASISALSVLARVLGELRLFATPVGTLAVGAAVFDDLVAWSMLALALGMASSSGGEGNSLNALYIIILTFTFIF